MFGQKQYFEQGLRQFTQSSALENLLNRCPSALGARRSAKTEQKFRSVRSRKDKCVLRGPDQEEFGQGADLMNGVA